MKFAVLWTHLSGYMNACLKELAESEGVELFVADIRASEEAPFDEAIFSWIENRYQWENRYQLESGMDADILISRLDRFQPDVILCANWHYLGYRRALKHLNGAVRIFTSDRPWLGRPRQWLGAFTSRFYLHPICEAIFVAGERQVAFAHKMGFAHGKILRGLYSCDHEKFSAIHFERKQISTESRSFIFVGRFSSEKGLDVLVNAYRIYRKNSTDPWPLKCYGSGPLQHLIDGNEGIECGGFCQPDDLPRKLLEASCLVLPSTFEPWALVVHEAAAAGMSVIVSSAVGASVHLVQDGYNGYIVETGDANELAQAMLRYDSLSHYERRMMGENSYRMSLQFTPKRWANTLLTKAGELMANKGNN
jgi:glycosyltransferase involved in cell wall biosynthesis